MRPVLVVVERVGREDVLEVAAADDQEPIEALTADGSDPALGVRSRLGCPYRRFDHADAFGVKDLVEVAGEFAVAVTDEEPWAEILVVELHQQVACLLGHPAAVRVGGDPGQLDAAGRQLDEEQDVETLRKSVSTVRKSHSRMLAACWRRNSVQLASSRVGAGRSPSP